LSLEYLRGLPAVYVEMMATKIPAEKNGAPARFQRTTLSTPSETERNCCIWAIAVVASGHRMETVSARDF
jgi:hypothetical protein